MSFELNDHVGVLSHHTDDNVEFGIRLRSDPGLTYFEDKVAKQHDLSRCVNMVGTRDKFNVTDHPSVFIGVGRVKHVLSWSIPCGNDFNGILIVIEHGERVLAAIDDSDAVSVPKALVDDTGCYRFAGFGAKDSALGVGQAIDFLCP